MSKLYIFALFLGIVSGCLNADDTDLSDVQNALKTHDAHRLEFLFNGKVIKVIDEDQGNTIIHLLAMHGNIEEIERIIKVSKYLSLGDILNRRNHQGNTPLHLAVLNRNYPLLRWLLEHEVHREITEENGATALFLAFFRSDYEALRILRHHGANINAHYIRNRTPLHGALIRDGFEEMALELVRLGADVNSADDRGASPFHIAVGLHRMQVIEPFLNAGADINQYYDQRTPLIIAAQNGFADVLQILLDHNADVLLTDQQGRNALHYAIQHQHEDCALALLTRHPELASIADHGGRTPLHYAAQFGLERLAHYLVEELGTSIFEVDQRNRLPGEIAHENGFRNLGIYLRVEPTETITPPVPEILPQVRQQIVGVDNIVHRMANALRRQDLRRALGHTAVARGRGQANWVIKCVDTSQIFHAFPKNPFQ